MPTVASSLETRWGQLLTMPTDGYLEGACGPIRLSQVEFVEVSTIRLRGGLAGRPLIEADIGNSLVSVLETTRAVWSRTRTTWSVGGLFDEKPVEALRVENPFVGVV